MEDDTPAAAAGAASASTAAACSGPGRFVVNLPPGYHFLPTDAELVLHYLRPRLTNHQLPLPTFFDERILHYHPDRLIEKYREYGEDRWFFFTKRERKHEGGSRPNRATPDNGHWNATGSPRRIRSGRALVGRVRTLVFYEAPRRKKTTHEEAGPPPVGKDKADKGVKTEWTMYEYESLASEEEFVATCADGNAKMDVIVLCTIQKKKQKTKHGEESKEKITRTKRKTREKSQDAEQGSCAGVKKARKKRMRAEEAQKEDITLSETEAPGQELAVEAYTGVASFTVDPNADTSHCFFSNTSSPVSTPPQETMMAAAARGDNNHISVHPSNAAMGSSQFQAPLLAQEFVPYLHPKILAPPLGGGNNYCSIMAPMWMDQNFVSDQTAPPPPEEPSTAPWIYPPRTWHNTAKIVAAGVQLYGFAPGLSNGFTGDGHRLNAGIGYLALSRFPQSSAASMAGSDE
ncbi:hypothetical protein SETIT_9G392600v2 [Setaria italica]|uniref:NAC domain-containing protein n=1 Tax=Setaria italica TaxID=4555 RepID=A0A368SQF7_SETIT|nr:hypothetical protein SETIT_9G392600v2 [Setaria italica]